MVIYCIISSAFAIAIIVMAAYIIKLRKELRKPRNNVHFYVARDKDKYLWLYIGKPIREEESDSFVCRNCGSVVCYQSVFEALGLNIDDYKDLKWEDEPVEVFLNLED